jgi:hypothetical protein
VHFNHPSARLISFLLKAIQPGCLKNAIMVKWPLSFPAALSHVYLKSAVAPLLLLLVACLLIKYLPNTLDEQLPFYSFQQSRSAAAAESKAHTHTHYL